MINFQIAPSKPNKLHFGHLPEQFLQNITVPLE